MPLKPLKFGLNPKRLLAKKKPMTLIIGMTTPDRLLLVADREENSEMAGKRSVSKLYDAGADSWFMGIGSAGSGPLGDIAARKIIAAAKESPDFPSNAQELMSGILMEIHTKHIFPFSDRKQRERGISLIAAIMMRKDGTQLLFKSFEEIVKKESYYTCAGAGQDIAHYFLDNLAFQLKTGNQAEIFLSFVMKEAKSSVGGVSFETESLNFEKERMGHKILARSADSALPDLAECIKPFWRKRQFI